MDGSTIWKIRRHDGGSCSEADDPVAVEKKLNISVNGTPLVSLYCTPLMVRELVAGFLLTEGLAEGICAERMSILYGDEIDVDVPAEGSGGAKGKTYTSGCAGGVSFQTAGGAGAGPGFTVRAEELHSLFSLFRMRSELYRLTGCVHGAAVARRDALIFFAEDIGRHNAVDKVIGKCLLEGEGFGDKIMLVSGRLASEMALKCLRWGIPVLASRAAPTDRALSVAEAGGVTIVGFLRGRRMNVYTHPERISGSCYNVQTPKGGPPE